MAQSTSLFVGLDVHKDSIAVAHAVGGSAEPPVFVGAIGPRQADIDQLLRRLQGRTKALTFAYEKRMLARGRRAVAESVETADLCHLDHVLGAAVRSAVLRIVDAAAELTARLRMASSAGNKPDFLRPS